MTSLTTAGGLISFVSAQVAPVTNLGIVAPIGVMLAFFYSVTLLPALIAVSPIKAASRAERRAGGRISERLLVAIGAFSTRYPGAVLAGTGAVLLIAGLGVAQVRFSHDAIRWFPENDPLRISSEALNEALEGVASIEFLIDTGRENGLHDPDMMQALSRAMEYASEYESNGLRVGSSVSIVNVVKETHRALNENRPSHYAIPDDRELLAQKLLLFENSGSNDLGALTTPQFSEARVTVRMPWVDAIVYPEFIAGLEAEFRRALGPDVGLVITGNGELFSRAFRAVILSMFRSYAIALAIIVPMMIILVGNVWRGLVAMIPNLIPVYLVLGFAGWHDIPLDGSTMLIGAIVIGIAVDDTIHFMHKFNRYLEDGLEPALAVRETLRTTGSALLFTSLVLMAGFGSFLFAYMDMAKQFGVLITFATCAALAADVIVGPALMMLVTRRRAVVAPNWGHGREMTR
jgi:predicted RND superfamily exporter protein